MFPKLSLIRRIIKKIIVGTITLILITPAWQSQPWFPMLLQMTIANPFPFLLLWKLTILPDPQRNSHGYQTQVPSTSDLVDHSSKFKTECYHEKLLYVSLIPKQLTHEYIINCPRNYGAACVVTDRLFQLDALLFVWDIEQVNLRQKFKC